MRNDDFSSTIYRDWTLRSRGFCSLPSALLRSASSSPPTHPPPMPLLPALTLSAGEHQASGDWRGLPHILLARYSKPKWPPSFFCRPFQDSCRVAMWVLLVALYIRAVLLDCCDKAAFQLLLAGTHVAYSCLLIPIDAPLSTQLPTSSMLSACYCPERHCVLRPLVTPRYDRNKTVASNR
jgi:hypothetical protein